MMLHGLEYMFASYHGDYSRPQKGPSNHKSKSKTAHKRKSEKKARKIMRRGN